MRPTDIVHFATSTLPAQGLPTLRDAIVRRTVPAVVRGAELGAIGALLVDARGPEQLFRCHELLRALLDDPRRPGPRLHPERIVALVHTGDVQAAFALGRYGLREVVEERAALGLPLLLARVVATNPEKVQLRARTPRCERPAHLARRAEGDLPTVAMVHRHADETLNLLDRYRSALSASPCSVFQDLSTLLLVMVENGWTGQTNLATKAGTTDSGQFIGSFEFYRQLRWQRYRHLPDAPSGEVAMEVFIAVDEIVHELLHLLFLANSERAGLGAVHTRFAEELSVTWWQGAAHREVFPDWFQDHLVLEINDDFLLDARNVESRGFFRQGNVFSAVADLPWVRGALGALPERAVYVAERPDLERVLGRFRSSAETRSLASDPERLRIHTPPLAPPQVPATFRLRDAETPPSTHAVATALAS